MILWIYLDIMDLFKDLNLGLGGLGGGALECKRVDLELGVVGEDDVVRDRPRPPEQPDGGVRYAH